MRMGYRLSSIEGRREPGVARADTSASTPEMAWSNGSLLSAARASTYPPCRTATIAAGGGRVERRIHLAALAADVEHLRQAGT
jgi:hypothetical protein